MIKGLLIKNKTLLLLLLLITGCTTVAVKSINYAELYGPSAPKQRVLSEKAFLKNVKEGKVSYTKDIKPLLDSRCVACHSCYDAPCQLKLSSFAGLDRGATKQTIYGAPRTEPAPPTRLFIDAKTTTEWRKKDFFPVLNERDDSPQAALHNSLISKLLQLKRDNPLPQSGKLTDSYNLKINRTLECPTIEEFPQYQQEHPDWGMPYAMPGLSLQQEYLLQSWLKEGALVGLAPPLSKLARTAIAKWEKYLNGESLKQKLVFRYIYEHLFLGHIHFKGHPDNEFYRLVRSTTPSGQPVKEIATVLPYDNPGVDQFYYRLRPVESTIVDKTHFVYELSKQKMQRYNQLFFEPDYAVTELPSFQPAAAANPFKTFYALPYQSRYQFLLDNAQYFISGFIKGPVCRGQIALNVIRDRFWVVFYNPGGLDNHPEFTEKIQNFLIEQDPTLELPGAEGNNNSLFSWRKYTKLAETYLKNKDAFANQLADEYGGLQMKEIWDGEQTNPNAALTIFRHYDSATVVKGLIGKTPLSAWVVDYPIFERIHYLLVAGFDVYGTLGHQLATRMYMDFLRMDGENSFLRFMPADQRQAMHASWYKGISGRIMNYLDTPYYSANHETGMVFQTSEYKQEFFQKIRQHLGKAAGPIDDLNNCDQKTCVTKNATPEQQEVDDLMREIADLKGKESKLLPEMALLRVKIGPKQPDLIYTLLHNKALENVAVIIAEEIRREPENDTVTVVPGFLGSYPNYFFSVEKDQLAEFVEMLVISHTEQAQESFYSRFGIRRSNPEIWNYADWFNERHKKYRGEYAGLFDLDRYQNL